MATQNERVLALLKTGPKSTHEILREVPCIVHSRVAELRERGHQIDCQRKGDLYIYELHDSADHPGPGAEQPAPLSVPGTGNGPTALQPEPGSAEQLALLKTPQRGSYYLREEVA